MVLGFIGFDGDGVGSTDPAFREPASSREDQRVPPRLTWPCLDGAGWAGSSAREMSVRFVARVARRGVNPFVRVSRRQARALHPGWRRPLPVTVRLAGSSATAWRVNLMPVGDESFYLYLNGAMRRTARIAVGDRVAVEIEFDPAYRGGPLRPVPRWFTQAIGQRPNAAAHWAALPPSRKKELVRYLVQLKSAEARARNLARALRVLSGARGRFMGREWSGGS